MLFLLKLHRNKNVITALVVLTLLLLGAKASYASHKSLDPHRIAYRTQLGEDLDGDQIPETATIRERGYLYQVNIHFTSGRPKLRLTTYVTEGVAGLSLQTTDVNNDSKGDLVIISATSLQPIGIWLNRGPAEFQKVKPWFYGGVGRYTGPVYRIRGTSQPEPVGNISIEPLPQLTPAVQYFAVDDAAVTLFSFVPEQRPFDSLLRQVPARGPPTARF